MFYFPKLGTCLLVRSNLNKNHSNFRSDSWDVSHALVYLFFLFVLFQIIHSCYFDPKSWHQVWFESPIQTSTSLEITYHQSTTMIERSYLIFINKFNIYLGHFAYCISYVVNIVILIVVFLFEIFIKFYTPLMKVYSAIYLKFKKFPSALHPNFNCLLIFSSLLPNMFIIRL